MKHFKWMVYNKIDKTGIWFKDTIFGDNYIFYWNPIKIICSLLNKNLYFGFFPLSTKHIKTSFNYD